MTFAMVTGPSGEGFMARVTELRPNSILLQIDRPLHFRDRVKIDLLGTELIGEVVYAADKRAAVTFPLSPDIFDLIEQVDSESDLPADAEGDAAVEKAIAASVAEDCGGMADLAGRPMLPEIDEAGVFEPGDEVEMLGHLLSLWAGRSVVVQATAEVTGPISLLRGEVELRLEAVPLLAGLFALRSSDRPALEAAIGKVRGALDRFGPAAPPVQVSAPAPAPPVEVAKPRPEDVPNLADDGRTVAFQSHAQFAMQHQVNIEKGALVVKAPPLPPGTKRDLQIIIPGAPPIAVAAQVMFQGSGTLGFSIAMSDAIKTMLRAVAEDPARAAMTFMDVTGSLPLPRAVTGPRLSTAIGHEVDLADPLDLEHLLTVTSSRPREIAGTRGSYVRVLDFLLASEADVRLRVTGAEEICLWLYHGRIVFSTRKPEKTDDLIGRRLVTSRATQRAIVEAALPEVGPQKPLGMLLVDKGKLTQEALNRELRAQIVDRSSVPSSFLKGRLQVLPWTEPPVRSKLLPVAGRYVMIELLRNELRRWTQEELTRGLAKQLDLEVRVDLDSIDTALKLGQKEHRFFQRVAQGSGPLGNIGTTGGAGMAEGLRLTVIGCALGFARLEKVDREKVLEKQRVSTEDILIEQLERTQNSTPFEVLGIHWSATQREIRAAYDTERKKLMMRRREDESMRELVQRMEKRLDEALRTLGSNNERRALRDSSAETMERQHAAEHLVQQAEIAIFREELEVAMDLLDTADELCAVRRTKQLRARLAKVM